MKLKEFKVFLHQLNELEIDNLMHHGFAKHLLS